jgi:hypothetical protein
MKIQKNDVTVNMNLDEFLNVLEANLFDELLLLIMELDVNEVPKTVKKPSKIPAPKEVNGEYEEYIVDNIEDLIGLLQEAMDNGEEIEVMSVEEYEEMLDDEEIDYYESKHNTYAGEPLTLEDYKVHRIVDRYRYLIE